MTYFKLDSAQGSSTVKPKNFVSEEALPEEVPPKKSALPKKPDTPKKAALPLPRATGEGKKRSMPAPVIQVEESKDSDFEEF